MHPQGLRGSASLELGADAATIATGWPAVPLQALSDEAVWSGLKDIALLVRDRTATSGAGDASVTDANLQASSD